MFLTAAFAWLPGCCFEYRIEGELEFRFVSFFPCFAGWDHRTEAAELSSGKCLACFYNKFSKCYYVPFYYVCIFNGLKLGDALPCSVVGSMWYVLAETRLLQGFDAATITTALLFWSFSREMHLNFVI